MIKKRKQYSPEFKAKVLLVALKQHDNLRVIICNLPRIIFYVNRGALSFRKNSMPYHHLLSI